MKNDLLKQDFCRYQNEKMRAFQRYFRKCQQANGKFGKLFYKFLFKVSSKRSQIEMACGTKIGGGLYIGHPYGITINPKAVIGSNCNLHKGVTIGQENRGVRAGAPVIGSDVWIGVNATVVGKITIGDDVLIAPNSYVNCDVPSHSVVLGNPCIIKHRDHATEGYINRKCAL